MRSINGSAAPAMPMTGYFHSRLEAMEWVEGNLANWNAYFTLRGTGEVDFGDERIATVAGELLLLPPRLARSYRIPDPASGWEFYWLHFRATPRLRHSVDWFDPQRRSQRFPVAEMALRTRLAAGLEEMHQLNLVNPDLPEREAILEALLEAWLLRVAAAACSAPASLIMDTRIERALEHFHRDIAAAGTIDELAHVAGLSRSQFCLRFRQCTGRTPRQYVEERRLEMAAYYLRTTAQSVTEVAQTVGFASPFHFTNRFRGRFGRSPRAYRRHPAEPPEGRSG